MPDNSEKILKKIRPRKIILPILIGLGVVVYMLFNEFWGNSVDAEKNREALSKITFSWYVLFFLVIALVLMAIRDIGYMFRLKILTGKFFKWKQCFNIIMLWEFTSTITPSAVGGTSVAIFYLHKEGLSVGRSSAVVMATSFLDELYFILMFPVLFFLVSGSELFTIAGENINKYFYFAVIGYSLKFLYTSLISYGLFFNPRSLKWLLLWVFRISFLRKWRYQAGETGSDLIKASKELKRKPFSFWLKAFFATFIAWNARYWVVNILLLLIIFGTPDGIAHGGIPGIDHILIYARQFVMWIMMIVMPTPGGSGFAEAIFSEYMAEFIPIGFVVVMALLWRLITYYPYLFIGVFLIPKWIKSKF